ncbi:hypothetical protein F5B19DRAFT_480598 [Rostrohypoxylon terebratum]|nr:hypothetical protein F5B19DRAFT_480598 [Rostrohypoxylon terebratum]
MADSQLNGIGKLVQSLVIPNAEKEMHSKCENLLSKWIYLLRSSQIPADASSTDTRIQYIFNFLFDTIQAGGFSSRLAYYRLYGCFETLENLIQAERKQGLHDGKKTASVAMDAVRGHRPNGKISLLRRIAKRWYMLAGQSVFFLFVYSTRVESIVYETPARKLLGEG